MIRKHEKSVSWKAASLAVGVHLVLLGVLFMSFNWKTKHDAISVSDVELWDALPSLQSPVQQPVIEEPKPEPKPEPIVEEKPEPIVEEKPEPEEPKVDIELEKKKKEEELKKKKELEKKEAEKKKKALEKKRKAEKAKKAKAARDKKIKDAIEKQDRLDKINQAIAAEEAAENARKAGAATASIVGQYKAKIVAKIRGNVNKTLCGDGNPELAFKIGLLPNGEYRTSPSLTKSSGIAACDEAVERAIIVSEPLPVPKEPDALAKFRDLNLKFTPNR